MRDPIENISKLQKQLNDLQLENQILKNLLDQAGVSYKQELLHIKASEELADYDPEQGKRIVHPNQITEDMANNFFARFWGRRDVYAKRNENKDTGKAGYFTQCRNFWTDKCNRELKTGIPCKKCEYYKYKSLTIDDILAHLRGNSYNATDVIGVYPLLQNNTCRFLVFDFDNHEKNAEENDFANVDDTWIEEVEQKRI